MKKKARLTWLVILVLIMASLACNLPFLGIESDATEQPAGAATSANTAIPGVPTATRVQPAATITPTPKGPNPIPLPLRQGMASLDTFRIKIQVLTSGPTKADRVENTTLIEANTKTESTHMRLQMTSSSASDPVPETEITDQYSVAGKSCSISTSGSSTKTPTGELTESDPIASDIANTFSSLVDYNVYVENPVFVAQETLNGIATNHFTFKVTRLGKESGGVVTQNSGEYWVAKDGQYLVKYRVILELSSDKAGTKVNRSEITIELTSINQPMEITIPANCVKQ